MTEACTCGRIDIGMTVTETRNWNPDCTEHGTQSTWWTSEEQVQARHESRQHLRDLWKKAREARQVQKTVCPRCLGSGIDPEDDLIPASSWELPASPPCRNCQTGTQHA